MQITQKRVRISRDAMLHGGELGYTVDGGIPPVTGWICVLLDSARPSATKWFPPSKVETVKDGD